MPKQDSINISLPDLQNVLNLVKEKKYEGPEIEITMTNTTISVRDCNGFLIGYIQKTIQE